MAKVPAVTREIDGVLHQIDAARIEPWPGLNPRKEFDQEALDELAASIRNHGNVQPVVVSPAPEDATCQYYLVAGERRYRAAKQADCLLLCVVRELTWEEAVEIAVIENLDRADLGVLEEADGLQKLIEIMGSQKAVAERLSRSQPWVSNRIRLLELPEEVLGLIDSGVLNASDARDYLLPFVQLPEKKRTKLFAMLAEKLDEAAALKAGIPVAGDTVKRVVSDVAVRLSHPVYPTERSWQHDKADPAFDPELHAKECTCQGPRFWYTNLYAAKRQHARCFDDDWWAEAQDAALAEREEANVKAAAELTAAAGPEGGIVDGQAFREQYSYDQYELIADSQRGPWGTHEIVDLDDLPPDTLVVTKEEPRASRFEDEEDGETHRLYCVDKKALAAAQKKAEKVAAELADRRKAERTASDVQEAGSMEFEPWMLAEIMGDRPQWNQTVDIAKELGTPVPHASGRRVQSLNDLGPEQLFRVAKIMALRSRRGDKGFVDPIDETVRQELRDGTCAQVRCLFPDQPEGRFHRSIREEYEAARADVKRHVQEWEKAEADGTTVELIAIRLGASLERAEDLHERWWELRDRNGWSLPYQFQTARNLLEEFQADVEEEEEVAVA